MRVLMTSAALFALATSFPVYAQSTTAPGAVNPPTGAPTTVPSVAAQVGATVGNPLPDAGDASHTSVIDPSKGAIKDGRTLSTGQAVNTSANVSDGGVMLAGGMQITDVGGMSLGRVLSVTKDKAGQVRSVTIQTGDGVRRRLGPSNLTVKGGVAVTSQSEADLVALPVAR